MNDTQLSHRHGQDRSRHCCHKLEPFHQYSNMIDHYSYGSRSLLTSDAPLRMADTDNILRRSIPSGLASDTAILLLTTTKRQLMNEPNDHGNAILYSVLRLTRKYPCMPLFSSRKLVHSRPNAFSTPKFHCPFSEVDAKAALAGRLFY